MKLENHLKILTYDKLRRTISDDRIRLQKEFDNTPKSETAKRASLAARLQLVRKYSAIEFYVTDEG